jgi:hypothetical protein
VTCDVTVYTTHMHTQTPMIYLLNRARRHWGVTCRNTHIIHKTYSHTQVTIKFNSAYRHKTWHTNMYTIHTHTHTHTTHHTIYLLNVT